MSTTENRVIPPASGDTTGGAVMTTCTFPACGHPATGLNRAGQAMCGGHERVVVGSSDDLGHGRHSDQVDDQ